MKIAVSKYFNDTFGLSHAAFISICVHLIFFALQPFSIFDKPLVQNKKYKKIHLKVVNKPKFLKISPKKLEIKKPVIPKRLVLPKPDAIPVRKPIKQIESKAVQVVKSMVTPLNNSAAKIVEVRATIAMHKTNFNNSKLKYSAMPRAVKTVAQHSTSIVSSPVSISHAVRFAPKGSRTNMLDRNKLQPRTLAGTVDSLKGERYSTLIATRVRIKNSFNPQVRNMSVFIPEEKKQPLLSDDELNSLWAGYTTNIRKMIARAKIYPPEAREKGQQGKIHLFFKLGKDGDVVKLLIENLSGHAMLDKAAKDAVRDAGPFPPIPEKLNKKYVLLTLPVSFVLR